ncbi:MAG: hypothetical protein ACOZAM_08695 [Pseudomonadota bacterium]
MSDAPAGRERRIFWASLAVLLVAVPAALALRGYDSALAWRANQEFYPLVSEPGKPLRYGAAEWRLEGLYQLIGQDKTSAYILAEFEAKIDDPAVFAAGLCEIALTDRGERRWLPQFTTPREVRKARPSIDQRETCGGATIKSLKAGETVKMKEIFRAPAGITKFDLAISQAALRPSYLILR